MTPTAERLIRQHDANQPKPRYRHRLHGFFVEVVNENMFGRVLVKMPDGNMVELSKVHFGFNYEKI